MKNIKNIQCFWGVFLAFFMIQGCSPVNNEKNRPPVLDPIGNKTISEMELLEFTVTASDPDNDELTYSASDLPIGATFDPLTQVFSWIPEYGQSGNYAVLFTVTDDGDPLLSDSEEITITVEEILLEDNFPGYEENANWDNSWTTGIGSLAYYATDPGFARLLLDGPGAEGTYHNAEKKHNGITSGGFFYCDFEVRLRNSNNNGWDAPGAPTTPDPTYGLGSRGWGFWNNQMFISGAHVIWFTSISPDSDPAFRGTRVWIICDGTPVLMQDLGIDLTQWHTYRIQWRTDYIGVFVDDMINPIAEIIDPNNIPDETLSFTMWTDNYCFSGGLANPTISYLSVPDINQYIDVDYVKIYN